MSVIASVQYRRDSSVLLPPSVEPVSVLRPLAGAEDNTEANLRSLFAQVYPRFEVLLSVHEKGDPAAALARKVMQDFPQVPARLIVAGLSPLPNAKVWSLRALLPDAAHEVIVMSDSDVRLSPDALATVTAELASPGVGLVTCPYRAVGGPNLWPRLEAFTLNTEFLSGMLTARMLNGMDYALGCTIATRKSELNAIGGLPFLQSYLAEDFILGNLLHKAGRQVVLSRNVIEHFIGNDGALKNWKHRLRWNRSTRRSRGWGYAGELFTKTTVLGLSVLCIDPEMWGFVLVAWALRASAAWFTGILILNDRELARRWYLLPLGDVASFASWALGFFGKTITWRGRELVVGRDGTFTS